ncbi:MAG: recombinase family protein [Oscillospiraceae bacterium]|jgi:DNA invertase Pin-like site-specific DNA recombinase|nr:recombinase family protein [Oscillospiraceae bacterium]
MSQSNKQKNRESTAALYPRLSRDDGLDGDSNSIDTQKKLLTKIAREKGYTNLLIFVDDGVTGVTMNRPGFNAMMDELKKGYVGAVFVKDLSRLGRNHLEVGKLTEEFFPENDIRLVAVSDGYDSAEGEDDLNPIRHLFNEWYARDISRKQRIRYKVKGNAGEPLSAPPYGYIKNPDNPKFWIIDPEAAEVVEKVYEMALDGKGTEQIANALTQERILTPVYYWKNKGINRPARASDREPHYWNANTVINILTCREYVGDVVNFKTYSKSFKNKKRIANDPENIMIFENIHDPIIDRAIWEMIQDKRGKTRKRKTNNGEKNMFSGYLVCADCGHNLWFHFNQTNPDIKYFNCSGYNTRRGTCPTTHYIRADFLEQVVLQEIRRLTKYVSQHEDMFVESIMGFAQQFDAAQRERRQKELYAVRARDKELDRLFNRMYEDNVNGKIDDGRFARMSKQYTAEQAELTEKIASISTELEKQVSNALTKDVFISSVRKYTRIKKLNERIINELIERIEVHQSEKIDGIHVQKLTIHYNCVGVIEIPEIVELPKIAMQTRKGVTVSYEPLQNAVSV